MSQIQTRIGGEGHPLGSAWSGCATGGHPIRLQEFTSLTNIPAAFLLLSPSALGATKKGVSLRQRRRAALLRNGAKR
jgi:hypothetical protein